LFLQLNASQKSSIKFREELHDTGATLTEGLRAVEAVGFTSFREQQFPAEPPPLWGNLSKRICSF